MALCAGALLAVQPAAAMPVLSFDFAPTAVAFNAGTIDFDLAGLFDDFTITTQLGGAGDLTSLVGEIDGSFAFAATGDVISTAGAMTIDDGLGDSLIGDLNFETIVFDEGPFQFVTLTGHVDFNTPYGGSNSDLISLAGFNQPFEVVADFLYLGLTNLANLVAFGDGTGTQLNALGTVAIPEPRSLALLGLGLFSIGIYGRRWRRNRSHQRQSGLHPTFRLDGDATVYGTELAR